MHTSHYLSNWNSISQPLATAFHSQHSNRVVCKDLSFMSTSNTEICYVYILRDDLGGYVWLSGSDDAGSGSATRAVWKWIFSSGSILWQVTDKGSHSTASFMKSLSNLFYKRHHFTTPYCPWTNATVKRRHRKDLPSCSAMLFKRYLPTLQ